MPWVMLAELLGGSVKNWLTHKSDIEKKRQIARIENVSKGIAGYSDEYLLLVWSYPLIASFIPQLQPSVNQGFEFMATLPDWYVGGFVTISFAVFGIDKLFKWKG